MWSLVLGDDNRLNHDGLDRLVARAGLHRLDRLDNLHALDDLAEDRVLGRGRVVKVVEEGVVLGVDEDLRAARVGHARVSHRQCAGLVGELAHEPVRVR